MPPPESPAVDYAKRAALYDIARSFVTKVTQGFDAADAAMGMAPGVRQTAALMPQGPMLFNITLGSADMPLDGMINAQGQAGRIYVSLADYFAALEFPIKVDAKAGTAEGWFIREDKKFSLDMATRTVKAGLSEFSLSSEAKIEDGEIFVPPQEIAGWFGFKSDVLVSNLQIRIKSPQKLPIEERLARADRKQVVPSQASQFPLAVEGVDKSIGYPIVGVSSLYTYTKDHEGETTKGYSSSILTNGDFMKGRLSTQAQVNDQDKLSSLRATYVRESLQPELLGDLKARRYELGDTSSVRMPISQRTYQGMGARVSNIDPRRVFTNSSTGISGNAPPGWDVELYRGSQYIDHQSTGADGFYRFDSVDLFRSNNNFRVVLYGPQGEIREQNVTIPVDPYRLSEDGSAYDVSLSLDHTQAYRKFVPEEQKKQPRLAAIYEKPFGAQSAYDIGFTSGVPDTTTDNSEAARIETVHTGLSTAVGGILLNAGAAVENTGEVGAQLVARADYGTHQFRNETDIATKNFSPDGFSGAAKTFSDKFEATGPLSIGPGNNRRYNVGLDYGLDRDSNSLGDAILGYSAAFGHVAANQRFRYAFTGTDAADQLYSETSLRGAWHGFYLRGDVDYKIKPQAAIDQISLDLQHPLNDNLDLEIGHDRMPEQDYSENRLQMNWRTPVALISPSITRTSAGDTIAYVNTSFSARREPGGKIRFSNQVLGDNGLLDVIVFLDKNGNGTRDSDEEVIPDVTVVAPQNGGQAVTGADGYAHLEQLENFRQTDLYIEPDTLKDPFWLPASKGVSFLPRTGHVTELALPVVVGGQMEGTVYTQDTPPPAPKVKKGKKHKKTEPQPLVEPQHLNAVPARSVTLSLYSHAGEKIMTTTSEADGYYIFSPVHPGEYLLVVDDTGLPKSQFMRPDPVPVKITYGGDDITGKNIYLSPGIDVPVKLVTDAATLQKQEPALSGKILGDKTIVINLGQYRSRLLMSVMWYKIEKLSRKSIKGLKPLVEPSESYADTKTGEHTLRVGADNLDLKGANERCRAITKDTGITCTVEVLPGGMQMAGIGAISSAK